MNFTIGIDYHMIGCFSLIFLEIAPSGQEFNKEKFPPLFFQQCHWRFVMYGILQGCTGQPSLLQGGAGWGKRNNFGVGWGGAGSKILGAGRINSLTRSIFGVGSGSLENFRGCGSHFSRGRGGSGLGVHPWYLAQRQLSINC